MNTKANSETARLSGTLCLVMAALLGAASICSSQAPVPTPTPLATLKTQTGGLAEATQVADATPAAAKMSAAQLQKLLGPIALYPDLILTQVLAASTYPLEIVPLKQWLDKHKTLRDKELTEAVALQNWDSSVQTLASFPGVVDKLANHIQWSTDLRNAFLAQESAVVDSVQVLQVRAQTNGALKTNDKEKIGTEATDGPQAGRQNVSASADPPSIQIIP